MSLTMKRGGKTTELQRRFRTTRVARSKNPNVAPTLLIRRDEGKDWRYTSEGCSTHDRIIIKDADDVIAVTDLKDALGKAIPCSHIFIDEGQFFEGLKDYCLAWAREGKEVHVACLDAYGNHPGHDLWPEVAKLIPWAVETTKCTAICFKCAKKAPLTIGLDGSNEPVTKIGGKETWEACCIHCSNFPN